jgi:hypothetical protein
MAAIESNGFAFRVQLGVIAVSFPSHVSSLCALHIHRRNPVQLTAWAHAGRYAIAAETCVRRLINCRTARHRRPKK